jgi:hypothetical protein
MMKTEQEEHDRTQNYKTQKYRRYICIKHKSQKSSIQYMCVVCTTVPGVHPGPGTCVCTHSSTGV